MGSPKRLKIKDDLNYRKGGTGAHCSQCNNYTVVEIFSNGTDHSREPRCMLMGIWERSKQYRINPNFICDRYDNSEHLNRLGKL